MQRPDFTARKSAWRAITPLKVLLFWLVIPVIDMICTAIQLKKEKIEFYSDKVIQTSGVFSKREQRSTFMGIFAVSLNQPLFGRIFNYGDIKVDVVGKWDIDLRGIKNPKALTDYLQTRIVANRVTSTTIIA